MIPPEGTAILTAGEMRAAEDRAMAAGASVASLMQRAGEGVALAVQRLAGANEILILCGPGNNGGDGYIAATRLRAAGNRVRVATAAEPKTDAARAARSGWGGEIEPIGEARPATVLVDALYGTGVSRPLASDDERAVRRLAEAATLTIAVDLPSGVASDDGHVFGDVPPMQVTLALGALKPAHLLQPAAALCGTVRIVPIGVEAGGTARMLAAPAFAAPAVDSHKFSRGMVAVARGRMAGAALLAAGAAMHAGAGYVELLGASMPGAPHALVRRPMDEAALGDERIGALVVGPGWGRDDGMRERLEMLLAGDHPLVLDGDALHLVTPERLRARAAPTIVTPHAGEFAALFGKPTGSKLVAARAAAHRSGAVVVFKGPDTIIAAPDGQAVVAGPASSWLSTAGTGDVLAGAIGAMLAAGRAPLDAAAAGVWLHGAAARRLGVAFIADDLARALAEVRR